MIPPLITVGSQPPASSRAGDHEVVVVLPWVAGDRDRILHPHQLGQHLGRRTRGGGGGRRPALASGLSGADGAGRQTDHGRIAEIVGLCPIITGSGLRSPSVTVAFLRWSEPCTL
jgi:hypothetical protein